MSEILTADDVATMRVCSALVDPPQAVLVVLDSHELLRARCEQAEWELRQIDNLMARRPALDEPTRYANIAKAIDTARRCDQAERERDEAESKRIVDAALAGQQIEEHVGREIELTARIAALEAHVREWRMENANREDRCDALACAMCHRLPVASLALVPDTGGPHD